MAKLETIKIKSNWSKSGFLIINLRDFDREHHEAYVEGEVNEVEPPVVEPPVVEPPVVEPPVVEPPVVEPPASLISDDLTLEDHIMAAFSQLQPDDMRANGYPKVGPIRKITGIQDISEEEIRITWDKTKEE